MWRGNSLPTPNKQKSSQRTRIECRKKHIDKDQVWWMNRLIDACVDFSGSFSDFKERRRKLKSKMPSNNDHQGAANNQVSFRRNTSMY